MIDLIAKQEVVCAHKKKFTSNCDILNNNSRVTLPNEMDDHVRVASIPVTVL